MIAWPKLAFRRKFPVELTPMAPMNDPTNAPSWITQRLPCCLCLILVFWLIQVVFLCTASGQTSPQDFAEVTAHAAEARNQKDVPRAIELYVRAVQLKPEWSEGWWFLGSLRYGTGDYGLARDALNRFLALSSDTAPALALRGLCEFETGEYSQSLSDIQRALSLGAANQPRNESILRYHEALLLTRTGKFEDALRAYSFFAHDAGTNPELLLAIGLAGLRMPLLPKEVGEEQKALLTAAGNAAFHFMAGDNRADQAFDDLFQQFPTASNAHYLYGYLLFSTHPDEALTEFRKEINVAPSNAPASILTAWILLEEKHPYDALPYAERAVEHGRSVPTAQLVLGRSLLETGDTKGGLEHLEIALHLDPNNLETHLALVRAYSKLGRKDDAKHERQQCLQLVANETSQIARP